MIAGPGHHEIADTIGNDPGPSFVSGLHFVDADFSCQFVAELVESLEIHTPAEGILPLAGPDHHIAAVVGHGDRPLTVIDITAGLLSPYFIVIVYQEFVHSTQCVVGNLERPDIRRGVARYAPLVEGGGARQSSRIDRRAAGQQGVGRSKAAVVLQSAQQGIDGAAGRSDLVAVHTIGKAV